MQDLKPTNATQKPTSLEVEVSIPDQVITDESAAEAMRSQGLIMLQKNTITDLASIGINLQGVGVMRVQRGRALVSQQRLDEASRVVYNEIIELSKDKSAKGRLAKICQLSQSLGYLASKLTESQELMLSIDGEKTGYHAMPSDEPTTKAFTPGSIVRGGGTAIMAREVHLHPAPEPAKNR